MSSDEEDSKAAARKRELLRKRRLELQSRAASLLDFDDDEPPAKRPAVPDRAAPCERNESSVPAKQPAAVRKTYSVMGKDVGGPDLLTVCGPQTFSEYEAFLQFACSKETDMEPQLKEQTESPTTLALWKTLCRSIESWKTTKPSARQVQLLLGHPSTGKSTMTKFLAEKYNLQLVIVNDCCMEDLCEKLAAAGEFALGDDTYTTKLWLLEHLDAYSKEEMDLIKSKMPNLLLDGPVIATVWRGDQLYENPKKRAKLFSAWIARPWSLSTMVKYATTFYKSKPPSSWEEHIIDNGCSLSKALQTAQFAFVQRERPPLCFTPGCARGTCDECRRKLRIPVNPRLLIEDSLASGSSTEEKFFLVNDMERKLSNGLLQELVPILCSSRKDLESGKQFDLCLKGLDLFSDLDVSAGFSEPAWDAVLDKGLFQSVYGVKAATFRSGSFLPLPTSLMHQPNLSRFTEDWIVMLQGRTGTTSDFEIPRGTLHAKVAANEKKLARLAEQANWSGAQAEDVAGAKIGGKVVKKGKDVAKVTASKSGTTLTKAAAGKTKGVTLTHEMKLDLQLGDLDFELDDPRLELRTALRLESSLFAEARGIPYASPFNFQNES